MSEKEIVKNIEYSQTQMRLGNLPDYSQSHYKDIQGLLDLYNQEKEKNKKLEEVIDLMAEDIWKTDDYFTCKDIKMKEDCYADSLADGNVCGENCIKQYYFKKARGEENETN